LPVSISEQSFEPGDALLCEIEAFLASCRGERPVVVSGEDGARALQTAVAIAAAVNAGAPPPA
jgi:predicted dehydrogenase